MGANLATPRLSMLSMFTTTTVDRSTVIMCRFTESVDRAWPNVKFMRSVTTRMTKHMLNVFGVAMSD